jgi:hypothetical protein
MIFIEIFDILKGKHNITNKFFNVLNDFFIEKNNLANIIRSKKFRLLILQLNNILVSDKDTTLLLNFFCDIQRKYHSLLRFVNYSKYKISKTNTIDFDLNLNDFSLIHNKYKIVLNHCGVNYMFNIRDIFNITIQSITYDDNTFMIEPTMPKNPYNNINFDISHMYSVFIKAMREKIKIPDIFRFFINCFCNLTLFSNKYESLIIDHKIKNFHKNDSNTITREINKMLHYYNRYIDNYNDRILFHSLFPEKNRINIFKDVLFCYLNCRYNHNTAIRSNCRIIFFNRMYKFKQLNKLVGRKIFFRDIKMLYFISELYYNYKFYELNYLKCFLIPRTINIDLYKKGFYYDMNDVTFDINSNVTLPNFLEHNKYIVEHFTLLYYNKYKYIIEGELTDKYNKKLQNDKRIYDEFILRKQILYNELIDELSNGFYDENIQDENNNPDIDDEPNINDEPEIDDIIVNNTDDENIEDESENYNYN